MVLEVGDGTGGSGGGGCRMVMVVDPPNYRDYGGKTHHRFEQSLPWRAGELGGNAHHRDERGTKTLP